MYGEVYAIHAGGILLTYEYGTEEEVNVVSLSTLLKKLADRGSLTEISLSIEVNTRIWKDWRATKARINVNYHQQWLRSIIADCAQQGKLRDKNNAPEEI